MQALLAATRTLRSVRHLSSIPNLGPRAEAAKSRASNFGQRVASVVFSRTTAAFAAGALCSAPVLTGEDFFEHKFITNKDPDAIVDFYSTEDFLQILGVFPLAIHFVLAGVEWDLERENTMKVYDSMEISFTLEEQEADDGTVGFFQKRERFKNYLPLTKFILWDQTQCYGYRRKEDGRIEVFHRGESFTGPLPIRLLVQLHARYVIWATEKHINSPLFGTGTNTLEQQEHQRGNIPVYAMTDFINRVSLAYQVALESGKIAATTDTATAEKTLKKLQKLQQTKTQAQVSTMRALHRGEKLKRFMTRVELKNPEEQVRVRPSSNPRVDAVCTRGGGRGCWGAFATRAARPPDAPLSRALSLSLPCRVCGSARSIARWRSCRRRARGRPRRRRRSASSSARRPRWSPSRPRSRAMAASSAPRSSTGASRSCRESELS